MQHKILARRNSNWEITSVDTQIYVFVYFQFDYFPKSKSDSKSRFEIRRSIFLFKILVLKSFGQYLNKSKKNYNPLYFKIVILKWPKVFLNFSIWVLSLLEFLSCHNWNFWIYSQFDFSLYILFTTIFFVNKGFRC